MYLICDRYCLKLRFCFLYVTRPTQLDKLGISYLELLDRSVVQENVSEKFKNTYEANDYLIYGENMMFYANKYDGNVDPMQGMNVLLRNVETEEEISYTFSGGVDSGIGLASLSQGLYEVYVYDNYVKKRLYFQDEEESLNFLLCAVMKWLKMFRFMLLKII